MNWPIFLEIIYVIILVAVCIRIVYDTNSTVKTLAYLLLAIFIPFFGMLFYFSFGINYRKRQLYTKKIFEDNDLFEKLKQDIYAYSTQSYQSADNSSLPNKHLARYLVKEMSPLTSGNLVRLLINGEQKFPAVIQALEDAKKHIHIEYYIYENDNIGRLIEEIMIKKARQGVTVRFIYDDFGSRRIRKNIAKRLREAGVQAYPFYKIEFARLASRINYRNHRKIIVVDGKKAFVGGINISDRYINEPSSSKYVFWRDTHLMLEGPGANFLQYLFICDWNFCTGAKLHEPSRYFFGLTKENLPGDKLIQIAASGPDSVNPTILYTLLYAIHKAEDEILITTPYFIPDQSIMDAIIVASLGGVSVNLLVPEKSDSKLVELAACSYY